MVECEVEYESAGDLKEKWKEFYKLLCDQADQGVGAVITASMFDKKRGVQSFVHTKYNANNRDMVEHCGACAEHGTKLIHEFFGGQEDGED